MSISDDARRLEQLATSVTDIQERLRPYNEALHSVDREVAEILRQAGRAARINQAIGAAEERLRDLYSTLEQAADRIRLSADHHLNSTTGRPSGGQAPNSSQAAEGQRLRTGLPPDLPQAKDRPRRQPSAKTHGRWTKPDGEVRTEISGWDDSEPTILRTAEDVTELLDRAQAESREFKIPVFMQWYLEDSDAIEFGVGVNDNLGALNFTGGNWPGLWFSQGNPDAGEELLSYDYMSHERPVPASSEIAFTDVAKAALEFLSTGDRPTCITWKKMHSD